MMHPAHGVLDLRPKAFNAVGVNVASNKTRRHHALRADACTRVP